MELTNEFIIDLPIDQTWKVLTDLEFIAPCMPGAKLTEIEGDEYRGLVKIKVGPISSNYKGKASFVEQDDVNYVARLKAEGRDPRQGNANAMVTAKMNEVGDNQTNVSIHTDLGLSGKIASFGRGAIEDVSKKILGQFTDNLREKLDAEGEAVLAREQGSAAAETPAVSMDESAATTGDAATPAAGTATTADTGAASSSEAPAVRKIESAEPEAVDILAVSGSSMLKRIIPAAGGLATIAALIWWIAGR